MLLGLIFGLVPNAFTQTTKTGINVTNPNSTLASGWL